MAERDIVNAPPSGKWIYVWKCKNIANNLQAAVAAAVDLGLTGISVKVAQCTGLYNLRWNGSVWVDDILPPFVRAMKDVGIRVNGWHWVEGNDPTSEALRAVQRVEQLGLDGLDVDAEGLYKGKYQAATIYMRELRAQLPILPIGLSSYRYPTLHPTFPWVQFLTYCDYHLPQVYWNPPYPPNYGPEPELVRSVNELRAIRDIPILPAGRAYIGDGHPNPTPAEMTVFMQKAKDLGLPGFSSWAMDFLYLHPGGAARAQAIKDFVWETQNPPLTIEQRVTDLERRVTDLEG